MKLLKFKGEFERFKRYIRVYLYRNTVLSNHNLPDCDDFFEGLKLSFVTDYLTYKNELTSCICKNGYFVKKKSVMTFKSISSYQMVYKLYSISYMYADHHRRNKWVSEDWNGISANLSEWSRDQNGQYNIAIVMLVVGNVTPVTYHSQKLPFAKIIQWYYSFKLSISITGCYSTLDCLPSCQHSSRCTELILQFRIGSSDVSLKWRSFYFLWRNDLVSSFT